MVTANIETFLRNHSKRCYMGNRTTINIRREIREMLNKRKEYKRETYDEVLEKLLGKGLKEARKLPK